MPHSRTSPVWAIERDELVRAVTQESSMKGLLRRFGLNSVGGQYITMKRRLKEEEIDFSHFGYTPRLPKQLTDEEKADKKARERDYQRTWYHRSPKHRKASSKKWQDKQVVWLREYKVAAGCAVCGEKHPAVLQFHHLEPSQKEESLGVAVRLGWSQKRMMTEIEKCQVLCANCHFKLHWNENNPT